MRLYFFGDGHADGSGALRPLLGAKGAELAEMARLGVPVPPGVTIPTDVCAQILRGEWPSTLDDALRDALTWLTAKTGRIFGDATNPLLVSVRAGAVFPLAGTLTTVLNVGLNRTTVGGLARQAGDDTFAWSTLIAARQEFGELVLGIDPFYLEEELDEARRAAGLRYDAPLTRRALEDADRRFSTMHERAPTPPMVDAPFEQLKRAVQAAVASFNTPAAVRCRERQPHHNNAVAVNIQAMVFGNLDAQSGTGVVWTRNRSTGAPGLDGDFLPCAQGEAVLRHDRPSLSIGGDDGARDARFEARHPTVVPTLERLSRLLENHYRDMQQLEFTLEKGQLWVLQTREARRSFEADMRVAVDFVHEGLITAADALRRIEPDRVRRLLHPTIDRKDTLAPIATGMATSPGAATGFVVFHAADAERFGGELNMSVILIKSETTPDDIRAVQSARGIITDRGGLTSHAAVVTRQMGKPSIVGCRDLVVDSKKRIARFGDLELRQGDVITMDGSTGEVFLGAQKLQPPSLPSAWSDLVGWADERRTIGVRANADSAADALLAREFGAEGVGLVRTEHMFFDPRRINRMREVILSQTLDQRRVALQSLHPHQVEDFLAMFRAMDGLPVTIRLLDPPLHEFLPQRSEDLEAIGAQMGLSAKDVKRIAANLREQNPMLGHRGCRLAVSWPEIYDMQTSAIFEAMALALQEGLTPQAEILVPLVSDPAEFRYVRDRIDAQFERWRGTPGMPERPCVGSMIEVARACLLADEIAKDADFLSFGTNDLTQSVYGLSRDDAAVFLPAYMDAGLMDENPFAVLDQRGVGWFIEMAVKKARGANAQIRIGVCGEQSSDPRSIAWLQNGVVDYISCSPYRVPIARLAAGRAAAQSS